MSEGPDQTNGARDPRQDDPLGTSEQDTVTSLRIDPGDTDGDLPQDTDPQSTTTQLLPGDYQKALPERYRLIEMIGRGGMAEVFLAEDTRLNRRVAIKFLSGEFRKDTDRTRRFTREARAASALNHPNILIIHDISESEDAQYIVSEYVQGETLGARIRRGKIPLLDAVNIAIQVASALDASHKAGIVHRDVKPDNVMLRPDGSVKVLDFGLAKEVEEIFTLPPNADARTLDLVSTSPGLILGTPQYMSPEQTRGIELDPRTDVFSLGNIIYEMVTGHAPFPGKSMADILAAIISKEPRRLESYLIDPPVKLIAIVDKALRKERDERYSKMEYLLADLQGLKQQLLLDGPYQDAVDTGPIDPRSTLDKTVSGIFTSKFTYREGVLVLLAAAGVLGFYFWWNSRGAPQPAPTVASKGTVPVTSWSSSAGESVAAASISPDGRMVAYAATKAESTDIWVKPIAGGDSIQVTKNGFYNQYPVWSPNGHDLVFFSSRGENRGIWRASFTGGDQVKIATGIGPTARPLRWSTDGRIFCQDGSELFAVDVSAGKLVQVTDFSSQGVKPWRIAVSGDGTTIAYSIKEDEVWKLLTRRLDSESSDEIARATSQIDDIVWKPDGKSVIFSSSVDGVYQIFEKVFGSADPEQLSTGDHDLYAKDVSPDGSRILYGSVTETSDLWMIDTRDSKEAPVANEVVNEFWPAFAPDGKTVAYQSVKRTQRPYDGLVIVQDIPKHNAPVVVSSDGFSPLWSPDGRWVAFFRRSGTGMELWRVGAAGDDALKLAEGELAIPEYIQTPYLKVGSNHIAWSPDGSTIAYAARRDGVRNIWLTASDGSQNTMLTRGNDQYEKYCCPTWTPDGKSIVFISVLDTTGELKQLTHRLWLYELGSSRQKLLFESNDRFRFLGLRDGDAVIARRADPTDVSLIPGSTNLFSMSLETGAQQKINSIRYAYFHNIHLSPDGTNIAFVSRQDDITALWTVPVSGGTPRKILGENDPKILLSTLAWSHDGSSIVFGKQTRTNLLSMLTR